MSSTVINFLKWKGTPPSMISKYFQQNHIAKSSMLDKLYCTRIEEKRQNLVEEIQPISTEDTFQIELEA